MSIHIVTPSKRRLMNPEQANALLTLIADLARIIYIPPPAPEPADVASNGQAIREPITTS